MSPELDIGFPGNAQPRLGWTGAGNSGASGRLLPGREPKLLGPGEGSPPSRVFYGYPDGGISIGRGNPNQLGPQGPFISAPHGITVPNQIGGVYSIDPAAVRFSQDSCNYYFKNGGNIDDLAAALRNGQVSPMDIPEIRLVEKDGLFFSLDNRRLETFRRAQIPIRYRMATVSEIQHDAFKFTTTNDGVSIYVRNEPR
ncbi:MAG: hypothetical protein HY774_04210 [Acidobacteria bacterium]|nr:hypothetical protein [Acidobacteriota bacterium]